ncbi:MAG: DUF6090 family protein [Ignavibacteriaceae bacterium]|nr:DUF6090 family protein [Ignavibacteriaceae bacterium]
MSEQEFIKHAKKTYAILKSSENGWKSKLLDIVIEILIIVFAVSVSIWLHNWSEKRLDNKEAKEFFFGLKKDLENDISQMSNSKVFYENTLSGIQYILAVGDGRNINKDSVNKYSGIFFSSTDLDPHIGRYEGLKSSGKFKIIENPEMLNNIINLHESIIRRIQELNDKYYQNNEKLESVIIQNIRLANNEKFTNAAEVVNRSDFKILLRIKMELIIYNILPAHELGIHKCSEIIKQIDEELK